MSSIRNRVSAALTLAATLCSLGLLPPSSATGGGGGRPLHDRSGHRPEPRLQNQMKKPRKGALSFGGISRARTYDLHDVNE